MKKGDLPFLEILDVEQFGEVRTGAAYLVRGRRTALIETGTARSAPLLVSVLRRVRIDWIFVTHVHLDHAGGAGLLAATHPEATVVVHPRGLPHLVDPTELADGTRNASPCLFPLYGQPAPIPEGRLRAAIHGETFDLAEGVAIEILDSPGHAPHHVCLFEPHHRLLFAGDAVGHHAVPVDLPLTVPPRFDLARALASLESLRRRKPARIAFTHFGIAGDAERRISEYSLALQNWFAQIGAMRTRWTTNEIAERILCLPRFLAVSPIQRGLVRMCVAGAVASLPPLEP